MKVPNINLAKALRAYYSKPELSNEDIRDLFDGEVGSTRLQKLKKAALQKNLEMKKPVFNCYCINTEAAFAAWGIDIADVEQKYNKLRKLKLIGAEGQA